MDAVTGLALMSPIEAPVRGWILTARCGLEASPGRPDGRAGIGVRGVSGVVKGGGWAGEGGTDTVEAGSVNGTGWVGARMPGEVVADSPGRGVSGTTATETGWLGGAIRRNIGA